MKIPRKRYRQISAAIAVSELPAGDIAKFFREHPEIAGALLGESYDRRFTPSSFIEEKGNRFRVGWFTRDAKYQCVQELRPLIICCSRLAKVAGRRRSEPRGVNG